jgi:peptidoglycan/LPS O-acetylase OafA/YrhL
VVPELDGIRGVAIALVLAFHFGFAASGEVKGLVSALTGFGWAGVDLFFVLSGFLITGILLDSRGSRNYFASFYARRALRIFPIYYLFLVAWFGVAPLVSAQAAHDRAHGLWYWLYIQNWSPGTAHEVNWLSHTWSLAIEEQFYLLWPIVVFRAGPAVLAVVALLLSVLALLFRLWLVHMSSLPWEMAYRLTPSRLDALALGAFVASAMRMPALQSALRRGLTLGGFVTGSAVLLLSTANGGWHISHPVTATVGHTVLACGFALMIFAVADTTGSSGLLQRVLRAPSLRFLGRYSYAIYLFHWPIAATLIDPPRVLSVQLGFVRPSSLVGWVLVAAVGTLIAGLLALISWHVVEKHFLALKERWRIVK